MYKNMCARQNGPKWTDTATKNIVTTLIAHFYVQSCTTLLKKYKISCITWREKKSTYGRNVKYVSHIAESEWHTE